MIATAAAHQPLPPQPAEDALELTILMPCLNEAETLAVCVRAAKRFLSDNGVAGEVIVADNGSTDGSQQIANALGARIVHVPARGYGAALMGGIAAARGRYVAMGDADDSYDFSGLMPFVEALRGGAELVMGNRFRGGIEAGAMPPLHRWLGNPVLSALGRAFFRVPIGDFHCGLRAFRRESVQALGLASPGMEFASEMVVKAALGGLAIAEVPTTLRPDGRSRAPHLRTWRDGWRHLRFLLTYAPRWLLLYPGLALALPGLLALAALLPGDARIGAVEFGVHTMIFAAMAVLMGAQLVGLSAVAGRYGAVSGLWAESPRGAQLRGALTLERVCLGGGLLLLLGIGGAGAATASWAAHGFGDMDPAALMRVTIPSMLAACLGVQAAVTAFVVSLMEQRRG